MKSFAAPPAGARRRCRCLQRTNCVGHFRVCSRCWASTPIRSAAASTSFSRTLLDTAWRAGKDLDLRQLIQDINRPPINKVGAVDLESFYPGQGSHEAGDEPQQSAGLAVVRRLAGRRAARHPANALHAGRQAAAGDHFDRPSRRCAADVLRHDPAQRNAGLDSHAAGHEQPAGAALHGRSVRLLPAARQSAGQAADAHAAEAGPRVRPGLRAGHAEPGRSRLQRPVERRHVVPRPAANRARQGPRDRRPGRRLGASRRDVQSPENGSHAGRRSATACS